MATDLAGALISVRYGATPTKIRVVRGEFDSEQGFNRAVTSELSGHPRTVICSMGGKATIEGFFTKDSVVIGLAAAPTLSGFRIVTDVNDANADTIHFPEGGASEPGTQAVNFKWTGDASVEGMQTFTCEFHSNYGSVINTTIT